jgi:hypothetical protein
MTSWWLPRVAAWGLGAAVWLTPSAPDSDIRVTPVIADGQVSVSFSAPAAAGPATHEVVQSGLLMTLTFVIDLKQASSAWWDRQIAQTTVSSSVKFDNLTGVYQVSRMRDGHVTWSERTSHFAEAQAWLTTFDRVAVSSDEALDPNADYYIRVRMQRSPRRTFPLWFWTSDDGSGRAAFTFIR